MTEPSLDAFLSVVDAIYAASQDHHQWSAVLNSAADLLGANAGHLLYHDRTARAGGILVTVRTDPDASLAYTQHYHKVDPWAASPTMQRMTAGSVLPGQALVPHAELTKSEYYAGIGRPFGLARSLVGTLERRASTVAVVSFNRAETDPEFDRTEIATLARLAPHLRRALELSTLLGDALTLRDTLGHIVDDLHIGVIVLAGDGRPLFVNAEANRIASARDGLTLAADGLFASTPAGTGRLRQAIASALSPLDVGEALTLSRTSSSVPYQMLVCPVRTADATRVLLADTARVIVLVRDPDRIAGPSPDLLRSYFGLTPAEARFAAGLAEGRAAIEIGEAMRLSRSTTRWMLERVRLKTGARSQTQAVTRILGSLARLAGTRRPFD